MPACPALLHHWFCRLCWPPIAIGELEPRARQYLAAQGPARLGLPPGTPGTLTRVESGRNTLVLRWTLPTGETCFVRAWRHNLLVRAAREHALAASLLREAGLRVPELLWADDTPATMRRYRLEASVERGAAGRPLGDRLAEAGGAWPEGVAETLGRELARLHTRPGTAWGKPWAPRNAMADPRRFWGERVATLRRRIAGRTLRLTTAELDRHLATLADAVARLPLGAPALVHGDLSPNNVFLEERPDGPALTWIDMGTVHYGHPAEDLAMVRGWSADAGAFGRVQVAWRAAGGPDPGGMDAAMDAFERLRLLEKLRSRIVKGAGHRRPSAERTERLREEQLTVERKLAGLESGETDHRG